MKIGIDIMGGDFAPKATTIGAIRAFKQLPDDVHLVFIGDEEVTKRIIFEEGESADNFEFVHTDEVIGMDEHPSKAFSKKSNSSIIVGFKLLSQKKIDGFLSAGSTGAMLVGASLIVKSIPGIIRPAIAASVPQINGQHSIILDVGLNSDCKPDMLYQFAVIGSIYAENVHGISNSRVGLLNIGSEKEKGNILMRSTHELMLNTKDFNFIGNIEGTELFTNKVDVIICDGFSGNIVLKEAEAFYHLLKERKINDPFFERFNYENIAGTPILGINESVVIGHGVSSPEAIKNMILLTKDVIEARLTAKFKETFKQ